MSAATRDTGAGHVFLSYVWEDRARADVVQGALEGAGISVWRDTSRLWPGQDWRIEIRRAIKAGSLAFVACFSEHTDARERSFQNEELILAAEEMRLRAPGRVWLIPVRLADCGLPELDLGAGRSLHSLQRVDLFGDSREDGVHRLVQAVLRILTGTAGAGAAGRTAEAIPPSPSIRSAAADKSQVFVSQDGSSRWRSVSRAVKAARPGARIIVRPGVYKEFLHIDKPLSIIGEGRRGHVILGPAPPERYRGKLCGVHVDADLIIRGLTIKTAFDPSGIYVDGANLKLVDCEITGSATVGISVFGGSVSISYCDIHNFQLPGKTGLAVYGGRVEVIDSHIFDNHLGISTSARTDIISSLIDRNGIGVEVQYGAAASLTRCTIKDNETGISSMGAYAQITNCTWGSRSSE